MITFQRYPGNPILAPNPDHEWEARAVFNCCPIVVGDELRLVYRAMSEKKRFSNQDYEVSTIGCARSIDRVTFEDRRQLIVPHYDWERYGCEDPRVTKIDDTYYIFYTAIANYPHTAAGIKVALATTRDFETLLSKKIVTPFNAKAMSLFPEKINGKYTAILTVNTDRPPSSIALIEFETLEQMYDQTYWQEWYHNLGGHALHLLRSRHDQVEVGTPPIKTKDGWLLFYSYIHNYTASDKHFTVEALLLDLDDPTVVKSRLNYPLLSPERSYELEGILPNIVFPSGALVHAGEVGLYYGACDTVCALATIPLEPLLDDLVEKTQRVGFTVDEHLVHRYEGNPILSPVLEHPWESAYTFNPTALYDDGKVHILYRAMGTDDTSVVGYAVSENGYEVTERLEKPIYVPRAPFEIKARPGNSGCEDARITKLGDRYYLCYTAYDGINATRVAMSSIARSDFLARRWRWDAPQLLSQPGVDDKNACLFPEKIDGKFLFFHRLHGSIWLDAVDDLDFSDEKWLAGDIVMTPRPSFWDDEKIGITGVPYKTPEGWLLLYHGLNKHDRLYRLSAALLDLEKPSRILARLRDPILEPIAQYENSGFRPGTVFSCGNVVIKDTMYIYYGGGDTYTAVASLKVAELMERLRKV